MYENAFVKIVYSSYFCSGTLLYSYGSLKMYCSSGTQMTKIPVAWTEVVLLWIFYSRENKRTEEGEICTTKS